MQYGEDGTDLPFELITVVSSTAECIIRLLVSYQSVPYVWCYLRELVATIPAELQVQICKFANLRVQQQHSSNSSAKKDETLQRTAGTAAADQTSALSSCSFQILHKVVLHTTRKERAESDLYVRVHPLRHNSTSTRDPTPYIYVIPALAHG